LHGLKEGKTRNGKLRTLRCQHAAPGALSTALPPFALASAIGRGARFYLVAGLMKWGGARLEAVLRRYVDRIGWAMAALVGVALLIAQT
jgi:hypothetical protein